MSDASRHTSILYSRRECRTTAYPERILNSTGEHCIRFSSPIEGKRCCQSSHQMLENKFWGILCVLKESFYFHWPHCFRQLALEDINIDATMTFSENARRLSATSLSDDVRTGAWNDLVPRAMSKRFRGTLLSAASPNEFRVRSCLQTLLSLSRVSVEPTDDGKRAWGSCFH